MAHARRKTIRQELETKLFVVRGRYIYTLTNDRGIVRSTRSLGDTEWYPTKL